MKRILFSLLITLIGTFPAFAQEIHKGVPGNISAAELFIVQYEPSDIRITDEKHPLFSYYQPEQQIARKTAKLNAELADFVTKNYPYKYRFVKKADLNNLKLAEGKTYYLFNPAKLYKTTTNWATVVLNLQNLKTGDIYEVGSILKEDVYSARETMANFISLVPKEKLEQAMVH